MGKTVPHQNVVSAGKLRPGQGWYLVQSLLRQEPGQGTHSLWHWDGGHRQVAVVSGGSGISRTKGEGAPTLKFGAKTYYLARFLPKTA